MPDALFSDILMVGRGPLAALEPAGKTGTGVTAPLTRNAFAVALAEAVLDALPPEDRPVAPQGAIDALAQAVADIVGGRSIVLRLASQPTEQRRRAAEAFLSTVVRLTGTVEESRQATAIAKLAEVFLPDTLADARGAIAGDNLDLRDRFVATTSPLTSAAVAARAGHGGRNPYATAARWKKAGDIFSVHHRGTEYFPAFQFREGRPHPTVKPALAALPANLSPWQRAFWFVSTNGWLGDESPADRLDDAAAVLAAARREGEEVVG